MFASTCFDESIAASMPPTIVQKGELDMLAPEGAQLANTLRAAGIEVLHHEYPRADYDFCSSEPVDNVRTILIEITEFFHRRFSQAS